jgi:hypothetical protein
MPLNIAGQPSRIGGVLSRGLGWALLFIAILTLAVGIAGMMGPLLLKILLGIPAIAIALLAGGGSWAALSGGRKLSQQGSAAQQHAHEAALFAFAAHHGGVITAAEAAAGLNVQLAEADAMLTAMAREGGRVSVEVDPQGVVRYVFREAQPLAAAPPVVSTGVRVDTSGVAPTVSPEAERDEIRAKVDREFEQMRKLQDPGKPKT